MSRSILVGIALVLLMVSIAPAAAALTIVYADDFGSPATTAAGVSASWSSTATSSVPSAPACTRPEFCGTAFRGEFSPGPVTLTLSGLPDHDFLSVAFDLYLIRSWDGTLASDLGPDRFLFAIDGTTLLDATFTNAQEAGDRRQTYPEAFGSGATNDEYTGAYDFDTLGYTFSSFGQMNAVYRFPTPSTDANGDLITALPAHDFTVAHVADSVVITFEGSNNLQGVSDEAWGIDNVVVTTDAAPVPIPELGTMVLLAAGLVGIAAIVAVRRR